VEAYVERRDSLRGAVSAAREAFTRARAEYERMDHRKSVDAARRQSMERSLEDLTRQEQASHAALTVLQGEVESTRVVLAEREAEVERARARAGEAQEARERKDAALVAARSALDETRDRAAALDVRLAERRAQLDSLAGHVAERYAVDIASWEAETSFDVQGAAQRLSELKDRIARLGDVNITAIADAKELEERHAFLAGQRNDLETSIEDLRRTITELSRTTRTRFRDTFEGVNEKFRQIFVELFRGGQASLQMTNPHNLLETGVELEVQPPGKKVGNLAMLSGGERALTAVSLIMALFALRSTPFCLLDEVDAPLDHANVGRFNTLLHRMSDRTQFIVITHQPRTMENAHALYGITMAEAGVSQVVSVEFAANDTESVSLAATA
jgi:chromosome segregation protein